ncbi:MAG TPA: hypothetical protein IAC79_07430, partial [Candidatus Spyradenecus faecavium]|nr:hypothetical protein [Candidatus Spyradenecus faecavium]
MADPDPKQDPTPEDAQKAPRPDAPRRPDAAGKGKPDPKRPEGEGPKWKRPFIVWVLLGVFLVSLFGIF